MLSEFITHNSLVQSTSVDESFEQLRVNITANEEKGDYVLKLFDELKTLSSRDSFELFTEISGTTETISDCTSDSLKIIEKHLNEYDISDQYDLELIVKKGLNDSSLSIYFIDSFSDFISNESYLDSLNNFDKFFSESLFFEVFSTIKPFGTKTIKFIQAKNGLENSFSNTDVSREKKIDLLRQNTSNFDLNINLLPSDFFLDEYGDNTKLNQFFDDACSILAILFLSNSVVISNERIDYKVNGYKAIFCTDVEIEGFRSVRKSLYQIYDWTYEGGSNSDKLGLVRNLLSLHPDSNGNAKFDEEVWEAVQSNYQIYLKGNIQSYLEVKNKIGEIILTSTTNTYEMVDGLLDSLKHNVLIIFTFILTVVVVNGLKDNGYKRIFSDEYTFIVVMISVLSALWLYFYSKEVLKRFDNATDTTKKILRLNYNEVLIESEIDKSIDPVISDNRIYLKEQIKRYATGWAIMLVTFIVLFVGANRYFKDIPLPSDATTSKKELKINEKPASDKIIKEQRQKRRTFSNVL